MNALAWFYSQSFNGRIAAPAKPTEPVKPGFVALKVTSPFRTLRVNPTSAEIECRSCGEIMWVQRDEDGARLPKSHVCDGGEE